MDTKQSEVYALMLNGGPLSCQGQGQVPALMLFTDREKAEHTCRVFGAKAEIELETVLHRDRLLEIIRLAEERSGAVVVAWNLVAPVQPGPPICDGEEPIDNLKRRITALGNN
jgi:hypothetical protein